MNPITSWIHSYMPGPEKHFEDFEDRIALESIAATKYYDERHGPQRAPNSTIKRLSRRREGFTGHLPANSAYKGTEAGYRNSYFASRYYSNEAKDKLKRIQNEIDVETAASA